MITAIIPHFFQERLGNLPTIVDSLQSQVQEIIIWNNDAPFHDELQSWLTQVAGVKVLQSPSNYGCQGRFAAVAEAHGDLILFHDNDLIATNRSVAKLKTYLDIMPGCISSATGEWRTHNGEAHWISRGRYELMERTTINRLLTNWKNGPESVHDDIWLNVQAIKMGIPRRQCHVSWHDISDGGVGFWHMPGFFPERTKIFAKLMDEVPYA